MPGNNGIARSQNGTIYVGSAKIGGISTFEEQSDHSLVLTDVIPTGKWSQPHLGQLSQLTHAQRL
jgi:hypothetical protein